jgi:hypothetical protein
MGTLRAISVPKTCSNPREDTKEPPAKPVESILIGLVALVVKDIVGIKG